MTRTIENMPAPTLRAALLAAVCLCAAPLHAQQPSIEQILERAGITDAEMARAISGAPVVRGMQPSHANEIAMFGVIATGVPYAEAAARLQDVPAWVRQAAGRRAFGVFSTPATAQDAAGLRVDPRALRSFRNCRPTNCDIKLPASSIREFQEALGSNPQVADAERVVRARLAQYANDYRQVGAASMVEYADKARPIDAAVVFDRMAAATPFLADVVPAFYQHVRSYPEARLAGARDVLYWATDELPSLRPLTTFVHAVHYPLPDARAALLAEKQLYAAHYFESALTLTILVDRPAPAGAVLVVMRRMQFDQLPGGPLNIRGRVTSRTMDALTEELAARRSALQAR